MPGTLVRSTWHKMVNTNGLTVKLKEDQPVGVPSTPLVHLLPSRAPSRPLVHLFPAAPSIGSSSTPRWLASIGRAWPFKLGLVRQGAGHPADSSSPSILSFSGSKRENWFWERNRPVPFHSVTETKHTLTASCTRFYYNRAPPAAHAYALLCSSFPPRPHPPPSLLAAVAGE